MRWRTASNVVYVAVAVAWLVSSAVAATDGHWGDAALRVGVTLILVLPRAFLFVAIRRSHKRHSQTQPQRSRSADMRSQRRGQRAIICLVRRVGADAALASRPG